MAMTKKHATKGGNAAVYRNMVKKGVAPAKAKRIAQSFRKHAKKA